MKLIDYLKEAAAGANNGNRTSQKPEQDSSRGGKVLDYLVEARNFRYDERRRSKRL